ncbi:MAG: M23 family metallopeptidase [Sphingobacteriales bacterium]|nr:M23 family metallopeptidase [Sphingobacteriales bacterium]
MQYYSTLFLWTVCCFSFSQDKASAFSKPMSLPFHLAGSFGEPRPDHFHSGIDIKTNGVEGEPVFSIYDGYVSRIKVSSVGYGKAIYITHPNGYTSLYAHLGRFSDVIEKFVHGQHYAKKQPEFDLYPDAGTFKVKQNDTIAFSGNTGGSTAPHLHFEIRDSKTEHALNPLDFYPKNFYTDTIPPQLNKVKLYTFNSRYYEAQTDVLPLKRSENFLTTDAPIVIDKYNFFCLSLEGFDKQDTSENKNGIYRIQMFINDTVLFGYTMNTIDFDKTRMCNAFVDYHEMMNDSGYFYNCCQLKNNTLAVYQNGNGFIRIKNKDTAEIAIHCYDYNENKTSIRLKVIRNDSEVPSDSRDMAGTILTDKKDSIRLNGVKITFPDKCFYDDVSLKTDLWYQPDNLLAPVYSISHPGGYIPLQKSFRMEFSTVIKKQRNKVTIVRTDADGQVTALPTKSTKTRFYTESRKLGTFFLSYDTTKPEVKILYPETERVKNKVIQVKIGDALSGIDSYNGYIDGKWVNFYYDAKNDLMEYVIDGNCPKGEHLLKIVVTDKTGNKTTVQQKFVY